MSQISPARKKKAGISLLEIMIALAIIALIVGLTAPRVMDSFGRAKSQAAEVQLLNVKGALQLYYIDVGRYPSEAEGLLALMEAPSGATKWRGPYIDNVEDLNDPWGRQFNYRMPGREGVFDLFSYGRDGHPGGSKEDSDITL
ncbi:type II secretion system major pseudopilin GspG [Aliiroseovarius crassostreae]|uniref:Type II secretion system core protein G n=1 Tax=Aliiroseovarius crassostreae TaxID=154981 RepID=A0A9Q9HE48_9RHOB|nr:type II secretion system major pseudopilin GspG [Aliiroseovarius crassostreae]UWP96191.1 type II secretion system major pseudopilin GspG [Aliiroseovarius crassostreae]